jgi:hypothetical protein
VIRRFAAFFLFLHGLAHVLGFLGSWQLTELRDLPYTTLVLNGAVDVGDGGIRVVGLFWLAAAVAVVGAGLAIWRAEWFAFRATLIATVVSLAICLIGMPAAGIGLLIDVLVLAVLVLIQPRPGVLRGVTR